MPAIQVFGWASLGGAVAAVVAFVLPVLASSAIKQKLQFNRDGLIAMGCIVIALALIAGTIALIPHLTSRGAALEYGLGVNGIIKGIASIGLEAFPQGSKNVSASEATA